MTCRHRHRRVPDSRLAARACPGAVRRSTRRPAARGPMLYMPVPGGGDLSLDHLVLDANGTLSDRGELSPLRALESRRSARAKPAHISSLRSQPSVPCQAAGTLPAPGPLNHRRFRLLATPSKGSRLTFGTDEDQKCRVRPIELPQTGALRQRADARGWRSLVVLSKCDSALRQTPVAHCDSELRARVPDRQSRASIIASLACCSFRRLSGARLIDRVYS
jgi:hypothetical protein